MDSQDVVEVTASTISLLVVVFCCVMICFHCSKNSRPNAGGAVLRPPNAPPVMMYNTAQPQVVMLGQPQIIHQTPAYAPAYQYAGPPAFAQPSAPYGAYPAQPGYGPPQAGAGYGQPPPPTSPQGGMIPVIAPAAPLY